MYPQSFVPNSGAWLSQTLMADRAPAPSHASALVLYLLSWTSILLHRFTGQIEKVGKEEGGGGGRGGNESLPRPAPVVPSAVNTSHRLHPRLATSIRRSDCRLLYDCPVLFSRPSFFSALAALIRPPWPDNRAIVSLSERGSGSVNPVPFSRFISPAAHCCLY